MNRLSQIRLTSWIFIILILPLQCFGNPALVKRRALSDLEFIRNVFEVKYAPAQWKKSHLGWNLDNEYRTAKRKIETMQNPTTKDVQKVFRTFFNSTCDYHVSTVFYSTERATLPFLVKKGGQRYFITYVDRENTIRSNFPLKEGDEILTFNGRPIDDVVQQIRKECYGQNVLETDQALAEFTLTNRFGSLGDMVPSGNVVIEWIRKGEKTLQKNQLAWNYSPEKIKDFSGLKVTSSLMDFSTDHSQNEERSLNDFFSKQMVYSKWINGFGCSSLIENKHAIGSRSSYIPPLGKKIWSTSSDSSFDAYIFKSPSNKKIGYIRIPHYSGCKYEADEFKEIIKHFQYATDGLVIDQINNPGGSVFYMYALLSMITDRPLEMPKHHFMLTQEDIAFALRLLRIIDFIDSDRLADYLFGKHFHGYPATLETVKLIRPYCEFIINEWNAGKIYTDSTHLFGIHTINPQVGASYKKPVLLLINSLAFSCGDFLPAALQDQKRVTILGTRTAGAGGCVLSTEFPNTSGIIAFGLTGSLAERVNQRPVENLGVTPDIFYELSETDLQENYCEYTAKILESIEALIPEQPSKSSWF